MVYVTSFAILGPFVKVEGCKMYIVMLKKIWFHFHFILIFGKDPMILPVLSTFFSSSHFSFPFFFFCSFHASFLFLFLFFFCFFCSRFSPLLSFICMLLLFLLQGSTCLFEALFWKFILSQPSVGWIKMKRYSPTNFSSP